MVPPGSSSFTQEAQCYGALRGFHDYEHGVFFSIERLFLVSFLLLLRIPEGRGERYDSGMDSPPQTLTLQRT